MSKNTKVLFIYPNTEMATLVPINLSQLSACLTNAGFEVALFDTTYYRWEGVSFEQKKVDLLQLKPFSYKDKGVEFKQSDMFQDLKKLVNDFKPSVIAITLVEDTFELGMTLLDAVKDYEAPVIAGGVFVTFAAEEVLMNENVDMVCLGEGEEALIELCEKMENKSDYTTIRNIWSKKGSTVHKNPLRGLTNIERLPFIEYDIFDRKRLYRPMQGKIYTMIHVEIDRGCPYDCTYCEAPHLRSFFKEQGCGTYFRKKSPRRIIDEMKYLVAKYNPDYINFNSEAFLAKPAHELRDFADLYKEIGLPFWCQSRPENVTEEKLKILKEMNCQNMQFGIEHGNEAFRASMLNRKCTNETIISALKLVEQHKLAYTVNNIIGFPDETRELVFDTIRINREINPTTMNVYFFTPYKGTRLYDYCIQKGYLDKDAKVHQLLDGVPLNMNTISYQELKGLQRTFPLYARFPEEMYDKIRVAEHFDNAGNSMFKELGRSFHERFMK